jgi:glycosyltransferase involved in cell wall biosynthesis
MARLIVSTYMVRYPLGGGLWWALQWIGGLEDLGHQVFVVEKANYPNACFDPAKRIMTDDPSYGLNTVSALLKDAGLADRLCFVDYLGQYHGMSRPAVETILRSADVLIDIGNHGAWLPEAGSCSRVLVDGEPGYSQMKLASAEAAGTAVPQYDYYFTNGANIGTPRCDAPAAGRSWRHVFNPVITHRVRPRPPPERAPFTTVMNWQSHEPLPFGGRTYRQKDAEFEKFMRLPREIHVPIEVAVAGLTSPIAALQENGWRIADAHAVTASIDSFRRYIDTSAGEFSVCKNVFVATGCGWFSDRSAAYLAHGRPVVIQDTGIREHLPCGNGLFAVGSTEEAAEAINRITADYRRHSAAARRLAEEHLDTRVVLKRFLAQIGV